MKTMKSFKSILAALLLPVAFIACTNDASTKEASATDTSAAVTSSTGNSTAPEANKQLVKDFIQGLYGDKDSTAVDRYIADNFKTHNPLLPDGKENLKSGLRPYWENPNIQKTKIDIKRIIAEGDMVWVMIREVAPNAKVFARVDIFRVENGKIAEAWKVAEPVPAKSENNNTMF